MTGPALPADHPDDFETFLVSWARETQVAAYEASYRDRCGRCGHQFHGVACTAKRHDNRPCTCPTALDEQGAA